MNPLSRDLDHVVEHTQGLWEELRGQRIFITGGTGFFGCWLLESFTWANDKLDLKASATLLTRNPEAFRNKAPHLAGHPAVHLLRGDVRSFAFPGGSFSHVIHAATESTSGLNERDPLEMLDSIIGGTRRVLDFAVACGARKFLLISSGAVYGKQPPKLTHVPETYAGAPATTDPRSAYGEGKRVAELLCAIYHQRFGLQTKIARGFAFAGPYLPLDVHFAIGNFIRDRLAGGPIQVKGDGTAFRSYLYAADLAIWLWTILVKGEPCRPYNVGSSRPYSIREVAEAVANGAPSRVPVHIATPPDDAAPQRYVPLTRRACEELDLAEYVSLEDEIRKTFEWEKALACVETYASGATSRTTNEAE